MYAVVNISGKQYRVSPGDRVRVDLIAHAEPGKAKEAGSQVQFREVLLIGGEGTTRVGAPHVDGASVTATISRHGKGTKIWVLKRRRRKGFCKTRGHRQPYTELEINSING